MTLLTGSGYLRVEPAGCTGRCALCAGCGKLSESCPEVLRGSQRFSEVLQVEHRVGDLLLHLLAALVLQTQILCAGAGRRARSQVEARSVRVQEDVRRVRAVATFGRTCRAGAGKWQAGGGGWEEVFVRDEKRAWEGQRGSAGREAGRTAFGRVTWIRNRWMQTRERLGNRDRTDVERFDLDGRLVSDGWLG